MHLHNPGEEFFFYLDGFPTEMPTYQLPTKSEPDISYFDIRLKNSFVVAKNTIDRPCLEGTDGMAFVECLKMKVITNITENKSLPCYSWYTKYLHDWNNLPLCKSREEFIAVVDIIQIVFFDILKSPASSGCFIQCNQSIYSATLTLGSFRIEFESSGLGK